MASIYTQHDFNTFMGRILTEDLGRLGLCLSVLNVAAVLIYKLRLIISAYCLKLKVLFDPLLAGFLVSLLKEPVTRNKEHIYMFKISGSIPGSPF